MLANLYNIPVDEKGWNQFSFANVDQHRKIISAIRAAGGIQLTEYIIDPIPLFDFPAWAYNHQLMHDAQNSVLGIVGNDLTTVDFSKPEQVSAWINLHFSEHQQAASILGLG